MANAFKNAGVEIGTTSTVLYTCPTGKTAVIHALYISNIDGVLLGNVDIKITIDGGTTYMFVGKNIPVPPDSTLTLEKPINLESNDKIALVCDTAFTLQAVASIMEVN
jgi:hypothetical protein